MKPTGGSTAFGLGMNRGNRGGAGSRPWGALHAGEKAAASTGVGSCICWQEGHERSDRDRTRLRVRSGSPTLALIPANVPTLGVGSGAPQAVAGGHLRWKSYGTASMLLCNMHECQRKVMGSTGNVLFAYVRYGESKQDYSITDRTEVLSRSRNVVPRDTMVRRRRSTCSTRPTTSSGRREGDCRESSSVSSSTSAARNLPLA